MNTPDLRYPIGKFQPQDSYTEHDIKSSINRINALPGKLQQAIEGLSDSQLNTPYRDGGWTIRQVVHHVADSHLHAYIRTKWALTEEAPLIKAYLEKLWAETPETGASPALSINLLTALHAKWCTLLNGLSPSQFHRTFTHPETGKAVPLDRLIALYAWHGEHHLAHITNLRNAKSW